MNLITIHNTSMPVVEYRGQRVVTLAMIDQVHQRPDDTAGRNFREHRDRLLEGSDYFVITRSQNSEIRGLETDVPNRGLIVLGEQGYLMLVKSLTDDLAWDVQRQLVNRYFRPAPAPALPGDYISALEHLLATKRSEQLAIEQRDHAVATKAEIGSRREATAMATASVAVREANRLRDELGFSARHATILKVETALKRSFSYVNLRRWCKANGVTPQIVPDKRYADGVKAWPAAAWAAVFDIDLAELFGVDGDLQ
jgi:hypothetical protein